MLNCLLVNKWKLQNVIYKIRYNLNKLLKYLKITEKNRVHIIQTLKNNIEVFILVSYHLIYELQPLDVAINFNTVKC